MQVLARMRVAACAAATASAVAAVPAVGAPYAAFDLAEFSSRISTVYSLNSRGWIVGGAAPGGPLRGYVWTQGRGVTELRPLADGEYWSLARDLNDRGWTVGWSHALDLHKHATLWDRHGPIDLGTLGGEESDAYGINNFGDVVGYADVPTAREYHAFLWSDGSMQDLGVLPGGLRSFAFDLNDGGVAVGWSTTATLQRAVLWYDGAIADLGVGTAYSRALGINDSGHIVGDYRSPLNINHAFLWRDGVHWDLHNLDSAWDSALSSINNVGEAVGSTSDIAFDEDIDAIFWIEETGMIVLNDHLPPHSGWDVQSATGINDYGQIVGFGDHGRGRLEDMFLLSPVHPTMTLRPTGGGLAAGQVNQLVVENATPGARVVFTYSLKGGGEFIPGCDLQENALQLDKPKSLGHRRANANGVAKLRVHIPQAAQGQTVLVQAVVVEECAVSELMVETVQ